MEAKLNCQDVQTLHISLLWKVILFKIISDQPKSRYLSAIHFGVYLEEGISKALCSLVMDDILTGLILTSYTFG